MGTVIKRGVYDRQILKYSQCIMPKYIAIIIALKIITGLKSKGMGVIIIMFTFLFLSLGWRKALSPYLCSLCPVSVDVYRRRGDVPDR